MIYVTGDTHLNIDAEKLTSRKFPEGRSLTKDDYVIICGDCGLTWDYSGETKYWQKWYNNKPWTTLCIGGNHENYDSLYGDYELKPFMNGYARQIMDSVYYLNNGDVFSLDSGGKKYSFFVMGGAASHDKAWRKPHVSWWEEEIPSKEMMEYGLDNLKKNDYKVDYVLSHCAPTSVMRYYDPKGVLYETDVVNKYLEEVDSLLDYKAWYHGHYHTDMTFGKVHCLYQNVVKVV